MFAVHAALFILVFTVGAVRPGAVAKPGNLSLISLITEAPAQSPPPPPALPSKFADQKRRLSQPAMSDNPDSDAVVPTVGGCAILEAVSKALVADPATVAAMSQAPPDTRSISEAVVIWNAGWADSASSIEAPLGPARLVVEQSLQSAAEGCLDEPITGPRLVPIPVADGNMFLVFGSGVWTWRDLELGAQSATNSSPVGEPTYQDQLWDWLRN